MPMRCLSRVMSLAVAVVSLTLPIDSSAQARGEILHSFANRTDGENPAARLVLDSAGNIYGTTTQGTQNAGVVFELSPTPQGTWTGKVLHAFTGGEDGSGSFAGLTFDSAGNLYGTTRGGGAFDRGVVFELTPEPSGEWTETVLYSFCPLGIGHCTDGDAPSSNLIFDEEGNLYGTTLSGGDLNCPADNYGCGVAFQLSPGPGGHWSETVLHAFTGGKDGDGPVGGLVFDPLGNLYGATIYGGDLSCPWPYGCGVVFELSRNLSGDWTEHVLRIFHDGSEGAFPAGDFVFDGAGNLYGSAQGGGDLSCAGGEGRGCGVIFRLVPDGDKWTEQVLHTFTGEDGMIPRGNLVLDAAGNVFGVTGGGGYLQCPYNPSYYGCGVVFELTQNPPGRPKTYVLRFNGKDGTYLQAGLASDPNGNLYGAAWGGGAQGAGVVFEVYAPTLGNGERPQH